MKQLKSLSIFGICLLLLTGCRDSGQTDDLRQAQTQPDFYIPGTAEMMNSAQRYHIKLWFAAINENWELADFELHELEEVFEKIEKYKADKSYIDLIPTIYPPIDLVEKSIEEQNPEKFKENFMLLTNTCTSCHKKTDHPFITIKIPESNPYSNQEFEIP